MGHIKNSFFLPAFIVGVIGGFLLAFFNAFNLQTNYWIAIAILFAGAAIGIFIGKIIEFKWIDVGLPLGLLVGGLIAVFCTML